jgi:hypothetical protein
MGEVDKRLSGERRAVKDRRSDVDTRSAAEKKLIGERRSNKDRRSGSDRRLSAAKPDIR